MLNNKENIKMTNLKRLTKKELEDRRKKEIQRLEKYMNKLISLPFEQRNFGLEEILNKAIVNVNTKYNMEILRRVK
jgi:uncharacterized FlaG/YvyC family protein